MIKTEKTAKVEKMRFMQEMEEKLRRMRGVACSEMCLRIMKRIFKMLRTEIEVCEVALVEHRKSVGKIAPSVARQERAKVRRRYRH